MALKPSTKDVLDLLRRGPQTTHSFVVAGCGSRFGARLCELRKMGYSISEERLPLPTSGSRYVLLGEPERALSETNDPVSWEQADPGSVPISEAPVSEGVRSAASAQTHSQESESSLFDSSLFTERGGYRDTERAA